MEMHNILLIARKELRDSLKNRWFLLYTISFTLLTPLLARVSMADTQISGVSGFGRTTAGMVNLILMIVPLMGLTTGAGSIAGERERGTLAYLLSQPVYRSEILLGKFLGLWAATALALLLGFAASAVMIVGQGSAEAIWGFVRLAGFTALLAAAMIALGLFISAISRRTSVATGIAVFLWLLLVLVSDLGLMSAVMAFHVRVETLFYLTTANPLEAFKLSVLGSIHSSLDVLGPAGLFATQTYGTWLPWIFVGALLAWIIGPLVAAQACLSGTGEA